MTRLRTKVLPLILSVMLAFGMLPAPTFAEMGEETMGSQSATPAEPSEPAPAPAPVPTPELGMGEGQANLEPETNPNVELEPTAEPDSTQTSGVPASEDDTQATDGAAMSESRKSYGYIPSRPVKSIHDEDESPDITVQRSLPSSYSSVDLGYVTPPKDQGPHGVCWAFAGISLAETYVLKHNLLPGKTSSTLDFSERHLAYNTFNLAPDPLGNVGDEQQMVVPRRFDTSAFAEYDSYLNFGGGVTWGGYTLANWTGAAYESLAPYDVLISRYNSYKKSGTYSDFLSSVDLGHGDAYEDAVRLRGMRSIPITDVDDVKAEIMDKGSMTMSYCHEVRYVNKTSGGAYYYDDVHGYSNINHDVVVVGWDDGISRSKFTTGSNGYPPKDGAWLCKGSWGTNSQSLVGGYFWISYCDKALLDSRNTSVSFAMEPVSAEDNQYRYDGTVWGIRYVNSGGSIASVFEAKACNKGELLNAVSFDMCDVNVNYSVQIYMNPQEGNPTSGTAMLSTPLTGRTTYEGFYKLDIPQGVKLYPKSRYSVVVTFTKDNTANRIGFGVCKSTEVAYQDGATLKTTADIRPGETYVVGGTGNSWQDLAENKASACVRAYTKNVDYRSYLDLGRATITASDCLYTGRKVTPEYKVVLDGHVLRKGVDYSVYEPEDMVSAGVKTVTIWGAGAYSGLGSTTFYVLKTFPDVPANAWYAGVVGKAAALGIVSGYKNGNFGPNDKITRGQVAVVLWNMAGGPAAGAGARTFPDVKATDYFYRAVRWASSKNVVSGYGNGKFGPNDNVTREQLATMLANYARSVKGQNVTGSPADYASMTDGKDVSSWAVPAVGWCFRNQILSGSGNKVNPKGNAARAEAAKMVVGLYDMLG